VLPVPQQVTPAVTEQDLAGNGHAAIHAEGRVLRCTDGAGPERGRPILDMDTALIARLGIGWIVTVAGNGRARAQENPAMRLRKTLRARPKRWCN
jgi:hypothetical protein